MTDPTPERPAPDTSGEQVEALARFLLEHEHGGDDAWVETPPNPDHAAVVERHKDWYRSLARDVLAFIGEDPRVARYRQAIEAHRVAPDRFAGDPGRWPSAADETLWAVLDADQEGT